MLWKPVAVVAVGLIAVGSLTQPVGAVSDDRDSRFVLRDGPGDVWLEDEEGEPVVEADFPPADVTRVTTNHRRYAVAIRMRFVNLRRVGYQFIGIDVLTPESSFRVVVESDEGQRGGTSSIQDDPCKDLTHRLNYRDDRVHVRIPRPCLDRPRWVKVRLFNNLTFRTQDQEVLDIYYDNPHNHVVLPRGFTPRLFRG